MRALTRQGNRDVRVEDVPDPTIELCRRGETLPISGAYGGTADPMPMLTLAGEV